MKWKRFAFNDVPLNIPAGWDLSRATGNGRKGELVLDDGGRVTLDAAWGPLGKRSMAVVEHRQVLADNTVEVHRRQELSPEHTFFLAQTSAGKAALGVLRQPALDRFLLVRVYRPRGDARAMHERLTAPLREMRAEDPQQWCFFRTTFTLPRGWLLSESRLQAGCMELVFRRRGRTLTLWDLAPLDHMEKHTKLEDYVQQIANKRYRKRLKFYPNRLARGGADPADLLIPGRVRFRWLVNPLGIFGCRRLALRGVANRDANRYSVYLFQYRGRRDLAWLGGLEESLRASRPAA